MQRIAGISLFSILALLFVGRCYSIHPGPGVFACFVVALRMGVLNVMSGGE